MPAQQSSPPRARTSALRRRISYGQPDLRVSDAERAEVADRLGEHYGDGRLDQSEFNERVDQAMRAKTRSDLTGLFDDLPDDEVPEAAPRQRRHRHSYHPVLVLGLVLVIAVTAGHALTPLFIPPWMLLGGLIVLVLYVARTRAGHHDHRDHDHDQRSRP
jgi:hypothetical protein